MVPMIFGVPEGMSGKGSISASSISYVSRCYDNLNLRKKEFVLAPGLGDSLPTWSESSWSIPNILGKQRGECWWLPDFASSLYSFIQSAHPAHV